MSARSRGSTWERGGGVESGGSTETRTVFQRVSSSVLGEWVLVSYSAVAGLASFGAGSFVGVLAKSFLPKSVSVLLTILTFVICVFVAAAFSGAATRRLGGHRRS